MEVYLVGGAVRDQLLGLPVLERDWVVVGATPQEMLDLGYKLIGKTFPVFLHPVTHEEYALARVEKITGGKLTLGKFLWSIREGEGETQLAFAKKLGISKQQLCDIEHNRKIVSPKLAASYAECLGYSTEHFIRLSLQDIMDRDGLNFTVTLTISGKHYHNKHHQTHHHTPY